LYSATTLTSVVGSEEGCGDGSTVGTAEGYTSNNNNNSNIINNNINSVDSLDIITTHLHSLQNQTITLIL